MGKITVLILLVFCCCRAVLTLQVQIPSPQLQHPKPPRPPSPIYEYVPSARRSIEVKEQDLKMIASESEERCLNTQPGFEASPITDSKQDLDMKLNKNERQDLETIENHNSEADLEMKENEAYYSIQI